MEVGGMSMALLLTRQCAHTKEGKSTLTPAQAVGCV